MAIYNIEARGQGMIIGDQTGIGKGRVAAAMIRYAVNRGVQPVFAAEKANLFSDIYRDLSAIGSGHLKPFIVNGRESKPISSEDGEEVICQAPAAPEQERIIESREIPLGYQFVIAPIRSLIHRKRNRRSLTSFGRLRREQYFILDEAHNSSGSSNREFLQGVVAKSKGVVFSLQHLPFDEYAHLCHGFRTDCNMSKMIWVEISPEGVALQKYYHYS